MYSKFFFVALLAALIFYLQPLTSLPITQEHAQRLNGIAGAPDPTSPTPGLYEFAPAKDINIPCPALRKKHWKYVNFATKDGNTLLGFAVVDADYLKQSFLFLNQERENVHVEVNYEYPLFLGNSAVSLHSLTHYENNVRILPNEIALNIPELELYGNISFSRVFPESQELSLLFPWRPDRFTYTNKPGVLQITASSLTYKGQPILSEGVATLDYTQGCELRTTNWRWASLAGTDKKGRKFLINLTSKERFHNYENVVFFEGKRILLGDVEFTDVQADGIWHKISSPSLDLYFNLTHIKSVYKNFLVASVDFQQAIGRYSGSIRLPHGEVIEIENCKGVGEVQRSLW